MFFKLYSIGETKVQVSKMRKSYLKKKVEIYCLLKGANVQGEHVKTHAVTP